jgi:hypothetical protein
VGRILEKVDGKEIREESLKLRDGGSVIVGSWSTPIRPTDRATLYMKKDNGRVVCDSGRVCGPPCGAADRMSWSSAALSAGVLALRRDIFEGSLEIVRVGYDFIIDAYLVMLGHVHLHGERAHPGDAVGHETGA